MMTEEFLSCFLVMLFIEGIEIFSKGESNGKITCTKFGSANFVKRRDNRRTWTWLWENNRISSSSSLCPLFFPQTVTLYLARILEPFTAHKHYRMKQISNIRRNCWAHFWSMPLNCCNNLGMSQSAESERVLSSYVPIQSASSTLTPGCTTSSRTMCLAWSRTEILLYWEKSCIRVWAFRSWNSLVFVVLRT